MQRYRTGLYGRTSSDDDRRLAIGIQQQTLREWSTRDPLVESVVEEFWDADVSGKIPIGNRPRGRELLASIQRGEVQSVAVAYIDRFGRTLLDGLQAAAELEKTGVKLVAVNDGWDARRGDDPMYFQFRLMIAEAEHRRIRERCINGRKRAAERDNAPPGGSLIFGYRMGPNGQFIIDPVEAAVVQHIFRLFLEGKSYAEILAWLESAGVAPGRRWQKRTAGADKQITDHHAGAKWRTSRIHKFLAQRAYIGERVWGGVTYPVPPIIDRETWDRVQAVLGRNSRRLARGEPKGLLSGLLICGQCGTRYHHMANNVTKKHRYSCLARRQGRCKGPRLLVETVDDAVWKATKNYIKNPEKAIRQAIAFRGRAEECLADLDREDETLREELAAVEAEVKNVWAEQAARDWPLSYIAPRLDALNARQKKIIALQADLRSRRAAVNLDRESIDAITAMMAGLLPRLPFADFAEKAYIIRAVLTAGEVQGAGKIVLHFKLGGSEERFNKTPSIYIKELK